MAKLNPKTTTIVAVAGSLIATAVILGAKPPRDRITVAGEVAPPDPVPPDAPALCGTAGPARASASFGPGTMTAALSGAKVLMGGPGEAHLVIDLEALATPASARQPLNLAIVIDRSGSMQGEKLRRAREAARGLVERLGEGDRVALVQYDDTARVLVSSTAVDAAGRARLVEAIDRITDGGGTNLHDGLALGRDEVLRDLASGRISRVVLLSDGNANAGVTGMPELSRVASASADHGVRVTTIGLGLDYNEDLMEAIAEHGRGKYYYVRDAGELDRVFAGELEAIQATVATAAELRLEPACDGVEIVEVIGYTTKKDGAVTVVPLADLAGGERRKIVARLRIPADRAGLSGVVGATLTHQDPKSRVSTSTRLALGVEVTADAAAVEASLDKTVLVRVEEVETAAVMREAAASYDRGDVARASGLLRAQKGKSAARAKKYDLPAKAMDPLAGALDAFDNDVNTKPAATPAAEDSIKYNKARGRELMH